MLKIIFIDDEIMNNNLLLPVYENHICELWSEELFKGRSSQL